MKSRFSGSGRRIIDPPHLQVVLIFLFWTLTRLSSTAQNLQWLEQIGGTGLSEGRSVVTDAAGNSYVTGAFEGTVDFDPGVGVFNLTAADNDAYVTKLDPDGNMVWTKQIGGSLSDYGLSITLDKAGNIYTTGFFTGTADFDPSSDVFNLTSNSNSNDIFVLKLDPTGNFIWAKAMGGFSNDQGNSLKVDDIGNVYTVGYFQYTADFDPGPNTFYLTAPSGGIGGDLFVSKLDASGNFLWAKNIGGTDLETAYSLSLDGSANLFFTGFFSSTTDFDPGPNTFNLTPQGYDIFVCKLNTNGDFIWAKQFGGSSDDIGTSIANDGLGNIYATGNFQNTVQFEAGVPSKTLTSAGSTDVFVMRLDDSGNLKWVAQLGDVGQDVGSSIALDTLGNPYATGNSINPYLAFVAKFHAAGDLGWIKQFGKEAIGYSIAIDRTGRQVVTGPFYGAASFETGDQTIHLQSSGFSDTYVCKMENCATTASEEYVVACDSYQWIDGKIYNNSTNATHYLTNKAGCDSLITLHLTINKSSSSNHTIVACNSYQWIDGKTYTESNNTATFKLTNKVGCDSVVTLNLTINKSKSATHTVSACDSYQWIDGITYTSSTSTPTFTLISKAGCDSVVTLHLTIRKSSTSTHTVSACNSYKWIDGKMYTSSNNSATFILANKAGCDSVVTLNLTIKKSTSSIQTISACNTYHWIDGKTYTDSNNTATIKLTNKAGCDSLVTLNLTLTKLDSTVVVMNSTIHANATAGTYQWINCDNNSAMTNSTSQDFVATSNGNYAAVITQGNCTVKAKCVNVTITELEESGDQATRVYPNPTKSDLTLEISERLKNPSVYLLDYLGREISKKELGQAVSAQIVLPASSGLYFLKIISANGESDTIKVVKE